MIKQIGKGVLGAITGGLSDRIFDVIEQKVSPEAYREIQAAREQARAEIARAEADTQARISEAYAEVLKTEAASDSALAKTARPGGVWVLTGIMAINYLVPGLVNALRWLIEANPEKLMPYPDIPNGEMLVIAWIAALGIYGVLRTHEKERRNGG